MTTPDPHVALLDDARTAASAAERSSQRHLRGAHRADATLAATLAALVDAGAPVRLGLTTGDVVVGRPTHRGSTHLDLRTSTGRRVLVATAAVSSIRGAVATAPDPRAADTPGRPATLRALLDAAVEARAEVEAVLAGGARVRGRLAGAGVDVLEVRADDGTDLVLSTPHVVLLTTTEEPR